MDKLIEAIQNSLTPDLLYIPWLHKPGDHPLRGHCYVASEALWWLTGRKLKVKRIPLRYQGVSHWYLENQQGRPIDITAEQFTAVGQKIYYDKGIGCGFLTPKPSKRAKLVIDRAQSHLYIQDRGYKPVLLW